MKKAAIHTLGCKVNTYDSEAILELLKKDEYEIVDFEEVADVYIVNTCTVTNLGDKKSRQMIRRAKKNNPRSLVVVCGCYAQTASEELEVMKEVDLILGNDDRHRIVSLIEEAQESHKTLNAVKDIMKIRTFEELEVDHMYGRERGFIKIQEGCDQFCTYCIIPYARGPVRSRDPERILEEAKRLVKNGNRELVLTGINICTYGKEVDFSWTLLGLLKSLDRVSGLDRIRLGSLEPSYLTQEVVEGLGCINKLCDHFHVSLQSGAENTLRDMKRRYDKEDYRQVLRRIRQVFPDAGITTDVMVGFPGESEEDFHESLAFVKDIGFSQIHVFKYSPRKGTPAAQMTPVVSEKEKHRRSGAFLVLGEELKKDFEDRFIGQRREVLVEQDISPEEQIYQGHTTNYMTVRIQAPEDIRSRLIWVELHRDEQGRLSGRKIESLEG